MKLFFEPSGDGAPAAIHDETGAIICEAKYDDFEGDPSTPERTMKTLVDLMNEALSQESPGFRRLKGRLGPEKYEALRQDTLRRQQEALDKITSEATQPITGNLPDDIVRDVVRGKRR